MDVDGETEESLRRTQIAPDGDWMRTYIIIIVSISGENTVTELRPVTQSLFYY